jgi:hypothetical protein
MDFSANDKFRFFGGEVEERIVRVYESPILERIAVIEEGVGLLIYFWSDLKPLTSSTI